LLIFKVDLEKEKDIEKEIEKRKDADVTVEVALIIRDHKDPNTEVDQEANLIVNIGKNIKMIKGNNNTIQIYVKFYTENTVLKTKRNNPLKNIKKIKKAKKVIVGKEAIVKKKAIA